MLHVPRIECLSAGFALKYLSRSSSHSLPSQSVSMLLLAESNVLSAGPTFDKRSIPLHAERQTDSWLSISAIAMEHGIIHPIRRTPVLLRYSRVS